MSGHIYKVGDRVRYDDSSSRYDCGDDIFEGEVIALEDDLLVIYKTNIISETNYFSCNPCRLFQNASFLSLLNSAEEKAAFDKAAHDSFMKGL